MRRSLVLCFVLASCAQSATVVCDDGRICPTDNVCDEVNHVCVYPDQLTSCVGMPNGTACDINHVPGGICRQEICIAARCGDGLVVGTETCDGADDIPDVGTCVDFAFDYGSLSCSAQCSEGVDQCGRLGWQFRSLNGIGGVGGIWEDGDDLYVTTQMGILRRHAGAWQPTALVHWWRGVWAGGGQAFAAGNDGQVAHFDGTTWSMAPVSAQVLAGIWGRSPTDVYAVGGRASAGEIWHFDGTAWTQMAIPGGTPHLNAIWGDATTAIAVGEDGTILRLEANATWKDMASGTQFRLTGVWGSGANDIFVTGTPTAAEPAGTPAIILHYGGEWLPMKVPGGTLDLRSIHGRSSREVYAVGNRDGSNILLFDGQAWAPMVSDVDGSALSLGAVHAGAAMVYAARRPDLFLEYAGAGWVESLAQDGAVRGIWGPSASYMIAVGDGAAYREYRGSWELVPFPACWGLTNFVFDVWGSGRDDFWIVGPYGKMVHRQAGVLSCADLPSGKWISDVWGSSATDVFVVGADGNNTVPNLAHYDGVTWTDWSDRVQPLVTTLSGVWGSSATNVYVVGDTKILHYDGTTWADMNVPNNYALAGVWGSSATDVFAIGDGGTILHFDGTAWSRMFVPFGNTTPTDGRWSDIHGTGPNDVYVVGTRTLLHYDGHAWSPIARTLASGAEAVFATPGVVVVGGDGGIDPRLIGMPGRQ